MCLLWFFLLVQELFEEQLGLQKHLHLLGHVQEEHPGVRSGPCGPRKGWMPAGCRSVGLLKPPHPGSSLGASGSHPPLQASRLWGESADGRTGVGERRLCLVAAWAAGGRPVPNSLVFPKQPLLGQGSSQSWAAMLRVRGSSCGTVLPHVASPS